MAFACLFLPRRLPRIAFRPPTCSLPHARACPSFSTVGVLGTVEENREIVSQTSINANALANDIKHELHKGLDVRMAGKGKIKTPRHRISSLSFPGLKEHDGLQGACGASQTRSNNEDVCTDMSMKALTLESLGFIEDSGEAEDPTETPTEDDQNKQTKSARDRKGSSFKRYRANDDESTDVILKKVVQKVRASPEEMKRAALDAAIILAKVAGAKIFINRPVKRQAASEHFIKATDDENGVTESKTVTDIAQDVAAEKPRCDHPWPEWVEFLEYLYAQSYFEGSEQWTEEGKSILETSCTVRHATFAFGRERSDIFRSLSQKDLRVLANFGCPDTERKTSNASKRLRLHFDIPEREVCQKCCLKKSCPRPFLEPPEKAAAATVDVVRVILGFAGNASTDTESRGSYPKEVENSARALLKEIVVFAGLPRDPEYVPRKTPVEKFPLESFPRSCLNQMKPYTSAVARMQGDWICPDCNFMNFARNKKCRECRARRPQELEILHGDWDCPKCRFLNFSKNRICRECQTERPTEGLWTGGEHFCEHPSTEKIMNERDGSQRFAEQNLGCMRNEKSCNQQSGASLSRSKSEYGSESFSDAENDVETSDIESFEVSKSESDEEDDVDTWWSNSRTAQSKDPRNGKSEERGFHRQLSAGKEIQKPNLMKREASVRKVAQQNYEASSEDAEYSDMDSCDSLELQDSESDVDLSEDETLTPSSSKMQRSTNAKHSFRWSDCQEKEDRSLSVSPSKTRSMGSKISGQRSNDSRGKAATLTSRAARINPAKSLSNGTHNDGEVLERSQPKLRIGKYKGGQSTVTSGEEVGITSFPCNSFEARSSKEPYPVNTKWSSDSRDRATAKTSKAVRVNPGKSGTDSDGEVFECSQSNLRIGKSKVGQPTVRSGKRVGVPRFSSNSFEGRNSKALNSVNSKGAKPLFDWSDGESEGSEGSIKKCATLGSTVKQGQVKSVCGRKVGTTAYHPQKNRSGEKGKRKR